MYTCYQVILIAEDGEYVQSEWQTLNRAYDESDKIEKTLGEGQRVIVTELYRTF